MTNNEFRLKVMIAFAVIIIAGIFGISAVSINRDNVVNQMVNSGVDPIEAGCAVGTISEHKCIGVLVKNVIDEEIMNSVAN